MAPKSAEEEEKHKINVSQSMVIIKTPNKINDVKISSQIFIQENKEKFRENYKIGHVVGSGAHGQVRKCLHIKSGHIRAVKLINKSSIADSSQSQFMEELNIVRNLVLPSHRTIPILSSYSNSIKTAKEYTLSQSMHVPRLCRGGELFEMIIKRMHLEEHEATYIMHQLLSAVAYCHNSNVVHRDLKPENLLLTSKSNFNVKIIDFGTAQIFDKQQAITTKLGTPYYIAPEVLNRCYDSKCDIWSAGVILYILLCGYPPFNGKKDAEIIKKVQKGKYNFAGDNWLNVSKEAKDLITKMLEFNPKGRISALEALNHPWIVSHLNVDATLHKPLAIKSLLHLKKFKAEEKLKQAAMSFIVTQLMNEKEKKSLQEVFQAIDANGDGKLSKEELYNGCSKVFGESMSFEQVEAIFEKVDVDGNGTIDYHEFLVATANEEVVFSKKNLQEAFNYMDKDGSGEITLKEIKDVLGQSQNITDDVWEQIIAEADKNGDGVISFDEFMQMMNNFK